MDLKKKSESRTQKKTAPSRKPKQGAASKTKISRKKAQPKKGKSSPYQNTPVSLSSQILKMGVALGLLVVLVMVGGILLHIYLPPEETHRQVFTPKSVKKTIHKTRRFDKPDNLPPPYEVFPGDVHAPKITEKPPQPIQEEPEKHAPPATKKPQVALIIDDLGYERDKMEKFLSLNMVMTFSILPQSPLQRTISREARKKGYGVMLHLPMEPDEYPRINPGPGALLMAMSPDVLIAQLNRDIEAVPHIEGVNNHMGSRMTASSEKMYQIFSTLKKKGLFFIDSRTSVATVCRPSARLLRVRYDERDVFLDHTQEEQAIIHQLKRLVKVAYQKGEAVGIGHPHELTYRVLKKELPHLKQKVDFVKASRLVTTEG